MGLSDEYCRSVHRDRRVFAEPDPGDPWSLGDYGLWDGAVLQYAGNISQLSDMPAIRAKDGAKGRSIYMSSAVESTGFDANANVTWPPGTNTQVVTASAGVQLKFNQRHQFWANLGEQENSILDNTAEIMGELVRRAQLASSDPRWWNHGRYRVVTKVTRATRLSLLMSMSDTGEVGVEIAGKAKLGEVDWGDAQLQLGWSRERGAVHRWPDMKAEPGTVYTPYFELCHVFIEPFNRGWQATGGPGQ